MKRSMILRKFKVSDSRFQIKSLNFKHEPLNTGMRVPCDRNIVKAERRARLV